MPIISEETEQIEQLRFWLCELTSFTPQQVETVMQNFQPQEMEVSG